MLAPAIHRLLEVADHREAGSGHARRHIVEHREGQLRAPRQPLVDRSDLGAGLEGPVARAELGHAVDHRTDRPQSHRRAQHEPEEHAEDMAVRGQQRMLDDMAQQLGARQLAGIEMAPLLQHRARALFLALLERVADVGEVMAELAKTQRQVEHHQIPQQGQQHAVVVEQLEHAEHQQRGHAQRDRPDHPGMVLAAGVEVARRPARPVDQGFMDRIALRQRTQLLDDQGQQDGKKTHVMNDSGADAAPA